MHVSTYKRYTSSLFQKNFFLIRLIPIFIFHAFFFKNVNWWKLPFFFKCKRFGSHNVGFFLNRKRYWRFVDSKYIMEHDGRTFSTKADFFRSTAWHKVYYSKVWVLCISGWYILKFNLISFSRKRRGFFYNNNQYVKFKFSARAGRRRHYGYNRNLYRSRDSFKPLAAISYGKNYIVDGSIVDKEYAMYDALEDFTEVPYFLKKKKVNSFFFNEINISLKNLKNKKSLFLKKKLALIKLNFFFKFYKNLKRGGPLTTNYWF